MANTNIIEEIHHKDFGTVFVITLRNGSVHVDMSAITLIAKGIDFAAPSGATYGKALNFVTDGSDGKLSYTIPSNFLNEVGVWQMQVYITTATQQWKSNIEEFSVFTNIFNV